MTSTIYEQFPVLLETEGDLDIRDKVTGMFLGAAIGDALGRPVETYNYFKVRQLHGNTIDKYLETSAHKWFKDGESGVTTDDWQLTAAIAESIVESGGAFSIDSIVLHHIRAFDEYTGGWGPSTKEAIQRLKDGISARLSGFPSEGEQRVRGYGNGVVMKLSPLAALGIAKNRTHLHETVDLTIMTHPTLMAVECSLSHLSALTYALNHTHRDFNADEFVFIAEWGIRTFGRLKNERNDVSSLFKNDDSLLDRINMLRLVQKNPERWTDYRIVHRFGRGGCYVYDSYPFSLAFLIRDPQDISTLYQTVASGGDTDTTGSMVGSLLGALHGTDIFPGHLKEGLKAYDQVIDLSSRFCDALGFE